MPSTPHRPAYTAGHFELTIDGVVTPVYLKSVEGGMMKMNSSDVQGGADPIRIKHVTTREVEPMTFEIGMAQVDRVWHWIAQSWRREFNRKDGHIVHGDQNYKARFRHDFFGALIEEVGMPGLDAGSKEGLFMKVKIRPERIALMDDNHQIGGLDRRSQKLWQASSFRLRLDNGVDTTKVNKIDAFTVKQGVKALTSGRSPYTRDNFTELEPTKIEFPDLKIHMTMQYASGMLDWYKMVVIEGQRETEFETSGAIEFLSPDKNMVLGQINLYGVGIKGFQIAKSEANADQMKRCSFDLYVSHMGLNEGDVRMQLEG